MSAIKACMREPALVTVITSNYNGASFLGGCVRSIQQQTYESWEHVIVDCGSTDGSADVLRSLMHPRLRVVREGTCGVAHARNVALKDARGIYCANLDVDDVAYPTRLERQVGVLDRELDVVAVGGGIDAVMLGYHGWRRVLRRRTRRIQLPVTHNGMALFLQSVLNPIAHSTLTFRKAVTEEIGGYREAMEKAEDFDLILRLSLRGRLAGLQGPVGAIRYGREGSHSARHQPKGRDALYYAVTALLYNTSVGMGLACQQVDVERWLDRIGSRGVCALQGRWALGSLSNQKEVLPFSSQTLLVKVVALRAAAMVMCQRQGWWRVAGSPTSLMREIARSG
jgi:glycosyltransferase involved in cell wall biosynthesis